MLPSTSLGIAWLLLSLTLCWSKTLPHASPSPSQQPDPDWDRNVSQLIFSKGYPCEQHKVITKDGYILGVYRIPHGRGTTKPGRPVLLQHGLLDAASTWVINFPDQSLGFLLADAGYDVWLGNMRGNYYSRAHVKYNPDHDEEFWDFTWDDMARDDLPSMIFYILNLTEHTQVAYVGHSQGTMVALAEFSRPDSIVENNVSFYAALAPVAHLGHIKSPLKLMSAQIVVKDIERYYHLLFGRNEYLPSTEITRWLSTIVCDQVIFDRVLCENTFFLMFGPDKKNLNITRVPVYASHVPAGTSVKNMVHFAQGVQTNIFQAYDYGTPQDNQKHYNQTTPPAYPIRPMKIPTAIFFGGEDWLADPTDVQFILDNLQNLVYRKFIPEYNHMDFIAALSVNKQIYADLIDVMQKYHPAN
jgi:pimeloyl-ACP methyl ester carboxylesterase